MVWMGRLRMVSLTATALIPVGGVWGQEVVAQDPHDSVRSANQVLLDAIPEACVAEVMSQASDACPDNCMMRVPNKDLPKADACDKRTWVCDWPTQAVGETLACPPGWNGTFTQDHYYKLEQCGSKLADTGKTSVLSVSCSKDVEEKKVEACPADGHWSGSGITYTRIHTNALEKDLSTSKETGVSGWVVKSVDCTRTVQRTEYEMCPYLSGGCMIESVGGVVTGNSCGSTPTGQVNINTLTVQQHLANDLVTVVTDSSSAPSKTRSDCPPPPPKPNCSGWSVGVDLCEQICGEIFSYARDHYPSQDALLAALNSGYQLGAPSNFNMEHYQGCLNGYGDGDPLVVDLNGAGVGVVPLAESTAEFDWNGRGAPTKTAWIASGDAFLGIDLNDNGVIDGIGEMFADKRASGGFADLSLTADTNKDGVVDSKDANWGKLLLWTDLNANGVCEPGEAMGMDQAQIASISVKAEVAEKDMIEVKVLKKSFVKMTDGMYHPVYEVIFPSAREQERAKLRRQMEMNRSEHGK